MEDCCVIEDKQRRPAQPGICPESGHRGKQVQQITLQSLLDTDLRELRHDQPYFFCAAPGCDVVYFPADGTQTYTKNHLQVPVFQKEPWDGVPVCYCFRFTARDIWAEIERTGQSTVAEQITQAVREGKCACEITNPQGSCCLGNVQRVVQAAEHGRQGDKERG